MRKSDLTKIEFIINRLVEYRSRVDMNDLQTYKLYSNRMDDCDIIPDFERVLRIIRKYDLARIIIEPGNKCALLNDNTDNVKEVGVENYMKTLNKKKLEKSTYNNLTILGDNKGIVNQGPEFLESSTIKNINSTTMKNPDEISLLIRMLSSPWIIGFFIALLTALLNTDKVMLYMNDKINNY